MKLPENIKQALCTELYFSLNDPQILGSVSNTILWDYLLSNNKINEIRLWIDAYCNPDILQNSNEINHHLKSLFLTLNITSDMIEYIDSSNASNLIKDLTTDYLSRYVFYLFNIYLLIINIFTNNKTNKKRIYTFIILDMVYI